jgi:dipeptidase
MCYQIAVGKKATADGSVLVARSCDGHSGAMALRVISVPRTTHEPGEVVRFPSGVEIPQVPVTYGYVAIAQFIEGQAIEEVEGGVNEYQVSAGSSSGGFLNEAARKVCPRMETSVGDYRMTMALQRAKTAREAVEIMADLTEKYGARTDNYMIADPQEVWMWEEFQGRLWVAARVPDDCFAVEANTVRIGEVDLDDPENFMGSKSLISFAVENGLYDPEGGEPFNAAKVYGAQTGKVRYDIPAPEYDRRRIWRGISLMAPSTELDPEEPSWVYPLFIKPDRKLTPRDLLNVMRDHYEGTKYDLYAVDQDQYRYSEMHLNENRQYQLSPSWNRERVIGISRSVTNWVAQLRGWLPNPIGGVLWGGLAASWANAHIPWYAGITKTPEAYNVGINAPGGISEYDGNSAYWIYETVTSLVNLFWRNTIDEVLPVWRTWEDQLFAAQPTVEKTALELYRENPALATEFLTSYSNAKGIEALEMAKGMIPKLLTIIARRNTGI